MADGIPDTLTFMEREYIECFVVSIPTDRILENDEVFTISLNSTDPDVIVTAPNTTTVTITDATGMLPLLCRFKW